ncbi:MAG: 2-oxoacid:acceptor oxidoreductase subunit alpha [Desulfurococcales archaeon]|nr:2-oxoacid:acceptor oxidoreductase subunit alpha [Desulfurococcales archaeon]
MVDLSFIIGGPQGGGVESAGQIALKAFVVKGYNVLGTREYHSNIMGAHSYYHVRVRDGPARALKTPVDLVVAIDAESVLTHISDVRKGGYLVYDLDSVDVDATKIASMEPSLRSRLRRFFADMNMKPTVGSAVKVLEERGVRTVGLPLKDMLKKVSDTLGTPIASIAKTVNVIGLTAGLYTQGVSLQHIVKAVEAQFGRRPKILAPNITAARVAFEFMEQNIGNIPELPDGPHKGRVRMIASGNEVVAMAKVVGGLTFETFYPITPASDEAFYIEENKYVELGELSEKLELDKIPIAVLQTEDEIAAINMAIGAAAAGARAATSTSGPGFSLMNEAISMAVEMEIPVVITFWMRAGPSTGIATRTGQQDLLHAIFSGHGDTPKIVIASGDHVEAFYDAIKAFNWAEEFQTPVVHLLDKYIASTITVLDEWDLDPHKVSISRGLRIENPPEDYRRYEVTDNGISPFAPLGSAPMLFSSLEHDEHGFASEDPVDREAMVEKRLRKFETIARSIPEEEKIALHGDPSARVTIVSFGSTKQAILSAMEELEREGVRVKFLQLRILSPFPSKAVMDAVGDPELLISVEANAIGQLALLLRAYTGIEVKHFIQKLNARPLYDVEVVYGVKRILGRGARRVVVSGGA